MNTRIYRTFHIFIKHKFDFYFDFNDFVVIVVAFHCCYVWFFVIFWCLCSFLMLVYLTFYIGHQFHLFDLFLAALCDNINKQQLNIPTKSIFRSIGPNPPSTTKLSPQNWIKKIPIFMYQSRNIYTHLICVSRKKKLQIYLFGLIWLLRSKVKSISINACRYFIRRSVIFHPQFNY